MKVFDDDGLNSYFMNIILSFIFLILIKLLWQTTNVREIQTFESIPNLGEILINLPQDLEKTFFGVSRNFYRK
jgi:hypothetical protein